jgi:hypothetical protein
MNLENIITHFIIQREHFLDILKFSNKPGIYAIFTNSGSLPHIPVSITDDEIIYIGKTEKSQRSRDANTHFKSGKTGSSTVRRSIGAIFRESMDLHPIPRSESDILKNRRSHFKFDMESESKVTSWMQSNLSLSFYEYPRSKEEIESLETQLIQKLVPILNLSKNPSNPYGRLISGLRKQCGEIAYDGVVAQKKPILSPNPVRYFSGAKAQGKYVELWRNTLPKIIEILDNYDSINQIHLDKGEFERAGNRKKYTFNLVITRGKITTISNSAVARDLASNITGESSAIEVFSHGTYKINMGIDFILCINKIN